MKGLKYFISLSQFHPSNSCRVYECPINSLSAYQHDENSNNVHNLFAKLRAAICCIKETISSFDLSFCSAQGEAVVMVTSSETHSGHICVVTP